MNKIFAPFLPPWAETGLQPAFYDVESGTVLQQTARMYNKVNQLTRLFNEFSEATSEEVNAFEREVNATVAEYIEKFTELKDFVDDYFDNLDVQEEINNKLDAMVEDGTLQEIITTYIQSNVAWTFDSVADMQSATNLINGSYAQTYGYYSANDGGGAKYLIRTKNPADTPDNGSIIAISDTLIAELIVNDEVHARQFGCKGDDTTDDTAQMQRAADYAMDHNLPLKIDEGTFLVSQILATKRIVIKGCGIWNTTVKSIENNTSDAVIKLLNDGMQESEICDLFVHGNDNTGDFVSGIKLYCDHNSRSLDRFTYLHHMKITYFSGHGIEVNGENNDCAIRELRMFNLEINTNNYDGLHLEKCTDSVYGFITSYVNNRYGYFINNGPHKMVNCKAFLNGIGDGETLEDLDRIPVEAFTATSDVSPVEGKTYYTRSGKGINGNWYKFAEFTGESFEPDVTYYEMTDNTYYKRYAGFYVDITGSSQFTNCESQDNYGDGWYVTTSNNIQFNTVDSDNNGFISFEDTYADLGLHPLYYGIYCTGDWRLNFNLIANNWRSSTGLGKTQRAAIYLKNVNVATGEVLADNQYKSNDLIYAEAEGANYYTYMDSINMRANRIAFKFSLDLNDLTLPAGYELDSAGTFNDNYIFKQDGIVYYRIKIKNAGGIFQTTGNINFFTLPSAFRSPSALYTRGSLSAYDGWASAEDANVIFNASTGEVTGNNYNVTSTSLTTLTFNGSYPYYKG